MNIAQQLVERGAGLRYHRARMATPFYRRAFGRFGRGTVVMAPLMLTGVDRIHLGDGIILRDGAWLAAEGPDARITVGSNAYVGHRVHLHSIDPVRIGQRCVFADNVMITTTDHDSQDRHGVHPTGPVTVGDDVFIGQNAVVLGGVTIGDRATVAAGAVVVRDVPPGATVGGVPAKVLGGAA